MIERIGKNIAALRKERGVKQEELANYVGVSAQAVSKWENGGVPDTELLPKIADFFGVSIDALFGRSLTDYADLQESLCRRIVEAPAEDRFKIVFNYCWDMERALYGNIVKGGSIEEYEKGMAPNEQIYSSILSDYGYTRMGIAGRLQYFLIVPEHTDTEAAFIGDYNYADFFRMLGDKDTLDALIFFNKRQEQTAFTARLLESKLGLSKEKAESIIQSLLQYNLLQESHVEIDDQTTPVYFLHPTPSFTALLIFAQEMIKEPNHYNFYSGGRTTGNPYLKG